MASIERIMLNYTERNPIGSRQFRCDECVLDSALYANDENKAMVRKAIAFMFKVDRNDCIPCGSVRFDFDDDTSLYCEAKNRDVWEGNKIVEVTKIYHANGSRDFPYRIDAATLRKQLLKCCDEQYRRELEGQEVMA